MTPTVEMSFNALKISFGGITHLRINAPGRQQSSLPRSVGIAEGASSGKRGGLNPTWVEWLMGFPMGWTELKVSATPSSRKSRKSSGEKS